jgi:hypothetical protein
MRLHLSFAAPPFRTCASLRLSKPVRRQILSRYPSWSPLVRFMSHANSKSSTGSPGCCHGEASSGPSSQPNHAINSNPASKLPRIRFWDTNTATASTTRFWRDMQVWRVAASNTLNCLIGCSIGDLGTMIFLQQAYPGDYITFRGLFPSIFLLSLL